MNPRYVPPRPRPGPRPPAIGHRPHTTTFYLGAHHPGWLATSDVPLFVSHRRLRGARRLPRARTGWALDSGGFMELSREGGYRDGPLEYVRSVRRYAEEIGNLRWAAIQDWMCEPGVRQVTGRSVEEHQRLTCHNYCMIRSLWRGISDVEVIPVLQGWDLDDYKRHYDMYVNTYRINLDELPLIGVGSVCRRNSNAQIGRIVETFAGLPLHGFGVKIDGLKRFGRFLSSADSMAWSLSARYDERLPECTHAAQKCANCRRYALRWRERVLTSIDLSHAVEDYQAPLDLFDHAFPSAVK